MSASSPKTLLSLNAECHEMASPVGTIVGDKYFSIEIREEDLQEEERKVQPVKHYRIYCQVELPERTWPGATYIQFALEQLSPPGFPARWPVQTLEVRHPISELSILNYFTNLNK